MFAVRHPACKSLWFNFEHCTWAKACERTTFATKAEAAEWAALPSDGGVACEVAPA